MLISHKTYEKYVWDSASIFSVYGYYCLKYSVTNSTYELFKIYVTTEGWWVYLSALRGGGGCFHQRYITLISVYYSIH